MQCLFEKKIIKKYVSLFQFHNYPTVFIVRPARQSGACWVSVVNQQVTIADSCSD